MKLMFLSLVVTLSLSVQAKIGYTKKQCDKAYGKTIKKSTDKYSYYYKQGKYEIKVLIIEGECVSISYYCEKGISAAEAQSLMKKNCKGKIKRLCFS